MYLNFNFVICFERFWEKTKNKVPPLTGDLLCCLLTNCDTLQTEWMLYKLTQPTPVVWPMPYESKSSSPSFVASPYRLPFFFVEVRTLTQSRNTRGFLLRHNAFFVMINLLVLRMHLHSCMLQAGTLAHESYLNENIMYSTSRDPASHSWLILYVTI